MGKAKMAKTTTGRVQGAVVKLERLGGQGVLVPGALVLTAAHCVGWNAEGGMALGDIYHEQIVTADGRRLTVSVYGVEPVSDIAFLGSVDNQTFPSEADAFEAFSESTRPVPLSLDGFTVGEDRDAFIFTHNKGVVAARAAVWTEDAHALAIEAVDGIDRGTSGGPIVTRDGDLLGVFSSAVGTADEPARSCSVARVLLASPLWALRRMIPPREVTRLARKIDRRTIKKGGGR